MNRTPPRPTAEGQKRNLSDSAELPGEKRQKDEDDMPDWAQKLFGEIGSLREDVSKNFSELDAKVSGVEEKMGALDSLNNRIDEIEGVVVNNSEDIADIKGDVRKLTQENSTLREMIERLQVEKASAEKVTKMHDEQLRNSMTICNVARPRTEKSWLDCKNTLAKALDAITSAEYSQRYWFRAIQRAHRAKQEAGKTPIIHAKFVSWADKDFLMNLLLGTDAPPNPDNIEFYDKFSEETEERRKAALARRKEIRGRDKKIKAYIRFPADLMVKKPGDPEYECVQKF